MLCAFRITPQTGVPPEEAGAAVAGESSTATWTVVWTDRLTNYEHYQAKCYRVEAVPNAPGQWIASIAYDLDLFEEGSIANLTSSIIGYVFGFKPISGSSPGRHANSPALCEDLPGAGAWVVMEREHLNKFGRPLLAQPPSPEGLSKLRDEKHQPSAPG